MLLYFVVLFRIASSCIVVYCIDSSFFKLYHTALYRFILFCCIMYFTQELSCFKRGVKVENHKYLPFTM